MKKLFLICLIFSFLVPTAIEAKKKRIGDSDVYWEFKSGVLTLSGKGEIPYRGVERIGKQKENIERIVIDYGITCIGDYAFAFATEENGYCLKSVEIANSVTLIGKRAFLGCNLESVSIPNSVLSIGKSAFENCSNLKNISISRNVTSIADNMFEGCMSLQSITIPSYVKSIGSFAFYNCKSLQSINIPSSVTTIGNYAFNGCSNLVWSKFIEFTPIGGDFIKVESDNSFGILKRDGKEIIPTGRGYTSIDYNSINKTFTFTKMGMKGVCNLAGIETSTTRIPLTDSEIKSKGHYDYAGLLKNGTTEFYKVLKNSRYGMTDAYGNEIVPTEFEALEQAGTGFLRYKLNGFWGVMDYTGKIIIDTDRGYTSIGDFVTFTKRFPYTMTGYKGECDINGRQISKIKVEAPQRAVATQETTNPERQEGEKKIIIEHKLDPIPMQEWQACWACGGMGTMGCDGCGSSGTRYYGDRLSICGRCNGRGIIPCNICHGNKGQYITVYR